MQNWLANGLRIALKAAREKGFNPAPLLKYPPLVPRVDAVTEIEPGRFRLDFTYPVDPALNHHRRPTGFTVTATDGVSSFEAGTCGKNDREIEADLTGLLSSGTWRLTIHAVGVNGTTDSLPTTVVV